jgi:phage tail sheath protein FI
MARAVQLFFLNGGTQCYVMRTAVITGGVSATNPASFASLTLSDTAAANTLKITAKYQGTLGNSIRAVVTNSVAGPSGKFDLELYRDVAGVKTDSQTWTGLSMDPTLSATNARYAPDYVVYKWAVLSPIPAIAPFNLKPPANLAVTNLGGGKNGNAVTAAEYDTAYLIVDKEVDLFNLMILPKNAGATAVVQSALWSKASIFCQGRRAFLLMDPQATWTTPQLAVTGMPGLRAGLVKDYSAIFYPNLTLNENGSNVQIGPSGAIAGLMARIDGTRGVWKAPAGTEADIRGISGLEYRFSDGDNGFLNPRGVNTIRIFPNGIVNWGARTMDGDDDFASEYKYIPIRRTALFIEESLYRGLKWVVFEPNDEPLWAQIRLNVGAFMHNLFRQGAFQGTKKQDAYFVKCDSETTTQNDINLGIVNIWVGFAPLKPAEFVILYLQQMTGQIQV